MWVWKPCGWPGWWWRAGVQLGTLRWHAGRGRGRGRANPPFGPYHELSAPVNPRPPLAEPRHGVVRAMVVELPREPARVFDCERANRLVVDAQIHVRVGACPAPRPRSAQLDRRDALQLPDARRGLFCQLEHR